MTTGDTVGNNHYPDAQTRDVAIADVLNQAVLTLAEAGCRHIQLDEPVFVRYVPDVLAYGVDSLERAFHGCPPEVTRTVHICCSYPECLDSPYSYKAPKEAYGQIASRLDDSSVMAVSLEDAHRHNAPDLFEAFSKTTVILGCFDIEQSTVESVEQIRARLKDVLQHIDRNRLTAAPDCGLGLLGRDLALQKLRNLFEVAATV